MTSSSTSSGRDPPSGELDPKNPDKIRVISVKIAQMTDAARPDRTLDERIKELLCAIVNTGTKVHPFNATSKAFVLSTAEDVQYVEDLSVYVPHSPFPRTGDTFGKIKVTSHFDSFSDFKESIMSFLQNHLIYLNLTTIAFGTRDTYMGWFYKAIPRFFNVNAATDQLAQLMDIEYGKFCFVRKTIKFNNVSSDVIAILCAAEEEKEMNKALLKAMNSPYLKECNYLASLVFVPRTLDMNPETNLAKQTDKVKHQNQFVKDIQYVYVENMSDIDCEIGTAPDSTMTIRDHLMKLEIGITVIHQSFNRNGRVVYVAFTSPDGHRQVAELVEHIASVADHDYIYHNLDLGFTIRGNKYFASKDNKRQKTSLGPEMDEYLASLDKHFPTTIPNTTETIKTPTTVTTQQSSNNTYSQATSLPRTSSLAKSLSHIAPSMPATNQPPLHTSPTRKESTQKTLFPPLLSYTKTLSKVSSPHIESSEDAPPSKIEFQRLESSVVTNQAKLLQVHTKVDTMSTNIESMQQMIIQLSAHVAQLTVAVTNQTAPSTVPTYNATSTLTQRVANSSPDESQTSMEVMEENETMSTQESGFKRTSQSTPSPTSRKVRHSQITPSPPSLPAPTDEQRGGKE